MKVLKTNIAILIIALVTTSACIKDISENISTPVTKYYSDIWKFRAGEGIDSLWMSTDLVDTSWIEVSSTKSLKDQNISLANGFGWYRKTIQFDDSLQQAISQAGAFMLHLGKMAACEEVYINGRLVGKIGDFPPNYKGYFDSERNYLIDTKSINLKGKNVVAIKFHDGWSSSGGFIGNTSMSLSSATTNDKLTLSVQVADSDYIFMGKDSLQISVNLLNRNKWNVKGHLYVTLTTDDYQPIKTDSIEIEVAGNGAYTQSFIHQNPTPGFYRYTVQFKRNNITVSEKKFNVGYEPEKIESPLDSKVDFKNFWDNTLKELAKVVPNYKLTPIVEASQNDYNMYLVEMNSFGGELIRGYYAKPKKEGIHPVIVEYMGYGSKPYFPNQTWDGFAYFVLSIRGQALNEPTNRFGTWITYGLDSKDNYYYRGAFMDVVRALDFVSSLPEIDANRIAVRGGSQGGALSFAAAALDKRVKVAAPNIPFLSDYKDYFKIASWPKSDFDTYMTNHPEAKWDNIYQLLTYFDIKNLAQWIHCPIIMGIGVQDNVCPPHINFAAYNQVKSTNKEWMAFPEHGHSVGHEFHEKSMEIFRQTLKVKKP